MFENFQWPEPEEEADEKLIRNVREHGCHVLNVHDHPPFSFSIGLALNYGQAEIVIFGMSPRQATQIINIVRDHAAAGKNYFDGDVSTDILVNGRVGFCRGCPWSFSTNISARRSGSIGNHRGRFPACNWCGRIARACFRGKRDLIRT
jgi:hypothetical protein